MAEYINREALPQKRERGFFSEDDFNAGWNTCLHEIEKIPSADVQENVKATIIIDKNNNEICSNSGCHLLTMYAVRDKIVLQPNFCPNCGAKMGMEAHINDP